MHRVTAICFDLDNTLWDVWPVIVRAEQAAYAFLTAQYPRLTSRYSIDALRLERERIAQEEPHMRHDFSYLRIVSVQRCALATGYCGAVGEAAFEVFFKARNSVNLYRDVLPTLDLLRGRYRLFTLTNGNADLAAIGLKHYFDASFAARDIGALKPDPMIFKHALACMQLSPEQVLHIGDDPVADVQGARQSGMHAVWLNREGASWSDTLGPFPVTLSRLEDLHSLLAANATNSQIKT